MTIIQRAARSMRTSQKTVDGREVRVTRGSVYFCCTAVVGESKTVEMLSDASVVSTRERNYLIDVTAYDFGYGPVTPEVDDVVTDEVGNRWVLTEESGGEAWSYSDPSHTWYRVHVVRSGAT